MRPHDDKKRDTGHSPDVVVLAIAALLLARLPLLSRRVFDPDELEHSHAAWCVFKGMLPYKDFFEHHTPWYYYTLRPFFNWFAVDSSLDSALHFLVLGRVLSLVLTIVSLFLVVRIGGLWQRTSFNRGLGRMAALLLAAQPFFLQKTLEIRPDMLALPFFLGTLWFLTLALAGGADSTARSVRLFLAGGLSLGTAMMCTQKVLFVLPGALAGLGLWALFVDRVASRRVFRIFLMVIFGAGVVVPFLATWAAFTVHGGGGEFLRNNFLLNAAWKHTETNQFVKLLTGSWPFLALSLVGGGVSLHRFFRSEQRHFGELLSFCTGFGLLAGVIVIPVAQRQYYLLPLPIVALFAAQGLAFLVAALPAVGRARRPLLALVALLLVLYPVLALRASFIANDDVQVARLREVFDRTKPTDLVMDGWEGMGLFRPHAFYYFFIHDELLPMLRRQDVDAYVEALESGKIRPKLIAMDEHLMALGPRFQAFVLKHYTSADGFFYFWKDR